MQYVIDSSVIDSSSGTNATNAIDYNCEYAETSFTEKIQFYWKPDNTDVGDILRSNSWLDFLNTTIVDNVNGFAKSIDRRVRTIPNAIVDKFNVDAHTKKAYSLEAYIEGEAYEFMVEKQIVLASGGIYTPGILERSGVGDPNILTPLNIPIVNDLTEVGENFQSHYGTFFIFVTNATIDATGFIAGHGLLSILPDYDGLRGIQLFVTSVPFGIPQSTLKELGLLDLETGESAIYVSISLLAPASRGSVHIVSREPGHFPIVNTNMYADINGKDLAAIVETLRVLYQAYEYAANNDTTHNYRLIYPHDVDFQSSFNMTNEESLKTAALSLPFIQDHWSSTVSMGTVLNTDLKVKNMGGVTVADTSAWPFINNGNTRTQALITGAFAAERLLEEFSS